MTCNLANIGDKTAQRKYNIKTVEVLESWIQVVLWSFLEKCYVENLTYINSVSKYMIGFSLFLTDWNVKHGKPQKSIFDVAVSSAERKPRDVPHKAYLSILTQNIEPFFGNKFQPKQQGSNIDWPGQDLRSDDAWDPGAQKLLRLSTSEMTQEFRSLCYSSFKYAYRPI